MEQGARMNIENLSQEELWQLHAKICDRLGFYIFEGIAVKDILEEFESRLDDGQSFPMPTDDQIREALQKYVKGYQSGFSEMVYDIGKELIDSMTEEA